MEILLAGLADGIFGALFGILAADLSTRPWVTALREHVQGPSPERQALAHALDQAYRAFDVAYPAVTASLFDEYFLNKPEVAQELARLLTPTQQPDLAVLDRAWQAQLPGRQRTLRTELAAFVDLLAAAIKAEPLLLKFTDSRAFQAMLSELEQQTAIAGQSRDLLAELVQLNRAPAQPATPPVDLPAAQAHRAALPLATLPPITTLPPGPLIPFSPNPHFCGRDGNLLALAQALKTRPGPGLPTVAISGIGGVGKSQLAVEFAHRYGHYFHGGVCWLSFADPAAIPGEITRVCAALPDLPPGFATLDQPAQLDLIRRAWCSDLPRLLIFDNCEDEALLEQWRPTTGGAWVLLTTRRDHFDVSLGVHVHPLPTLLRPDSVLLLETLITGQPPSRPAAPPQLPTLAAIAAELGDLPLALHVAGSYLNTYAAAVTPAAYLDRLRHAPLDPALNRAVGRSPTRHDLSVARTFALSYDRLDPNDPAGQLALALLARAACFAPGEPIPRALLTATLELDAGDPEAALTGADAYRRLAELGLLSTNEDGDAYLHRLLATFVLNLQTDDAAQQAVERAVIKGAYRLNMTADPRPLQAWLVHLRHITDHALTRGDKRAATLAANLGYHLIAAADYAGAKPYYERSLAVREQELGTQHPDTAQSLNNLGSLLQAMGDYAGAKPYYERSLAVREQVLGEQHPDTATSLNNLGSLLQDMGDYAGAKPYYERSLAVREQVLGDQHPDTAISVNNLGSLLRDMGDYVGAKPYLERSLAIYEQVFGEQHPYAAASLNNLGSLLQDMGDYAGAKPYYERSLAIRQQVLGERHPDTAQSLNNLGSLLYAMGDYAGARPYFERAVTILTATLGPEHPYTQIAQRWLRALDNKA